MTTKGSSKSIIARKVKAAVAKEPGLTIKDMAGRLDANRQFMAGFLAALEERGEISCRKVGPASIHELGIAPIFCAESSVAQKVALT